MSNKKYLPYRGSLKAIGSQANIVYFITRHDEKCLTPLYQFDLETFTLSEQPLESLSSALLVTPEHVWVGCNTGSVYRDGKKITQLAHQESINALANLEHDQLALMINDSVDIINVKTGALLQTLQLPEPATVITSDGSGQWLAVGTNKGNVFVYENESEDSSLFRLSDSEKLHDGAVNSLSFYVDELRFLSAGSDGKLLLTHARGKLEPENRARGAGHDAQVTAIVQAAGSALSGERFITGSQDKSCKTWLRKGGTRPATMADNAGAVIDMTVATLHNRAQLVIASDDYIRIVTLDSAGKFGELTHRIYDTYTNAADALKSDKTALRVKAVEQLANYDDKTALSMLSERIRCEADANLRKQIAEAFCKSAHPHVEGYLEKCLTIKDSVVRVLAFNSLLARVTIGGDLGPMVLALQSSQEDIGKLAVNALAERSRDDRAMMQLINALNVGTRSVRMAALTSLELVNPVEAQIIAISSSQTDIREAALIRLYQCKKLNEPRVLSALRRRLDDDNAAVRQTALLVSLFSRPRLVKAIRERDKNLHRLLFDIETFELDINDGVNDKARLRKEPSVRKSKLALKVEDYAPLLQATASLSVDSSLLGAHCLALINDPRALSMLLQLSREEEADIRVKVCNALAVLGDSRADQRLLGLLSDKSLKVRDAAYSALSTIHQSTPQNAAELGLNAKFPDIRNRALQHLIKIAKQSPPKKGDLVWRLLIRTLNDGHHSVRSETFKAALNLPLGGTQETALAFAIQSIHHSIRREVQTELFAESNSPWAWDMLLGLLNDADSEIRTDTLEFALKKTKGRDLAPLAAALKSNYVATRLQAVVELVKKPSDGVQQLLITAVNDTDNQVRRAAINALVDANAEVELQRAMQSEFDDVVLVAANACARIGDDSALQPLIAFLTKPKPDNRNDVNQWKDNLKRALTGLSELGLACCVDDVVPLLQHDDTAVRSQAAQVLMWSCDETQRDILTAALQHQDEGVKRYSSLGLSLLGDKDAMHVAITLSENVDDKILCISAMLGFGDDFIDQLSLYLDDQSGLVHFTALMCLILLDYKKQNAVPVYLLSLLSAKLANYRLVGAQALEVYDNSEQLIAFVNTLFNVRDNNEKWTIVQSDIDLFAEVIASGTSRLRCRTLPLLRWVLKDKQDHWDLAWGTHLRRYMSELLSLPDQWRNGTNDQIQNDNYELQMMAFGTYCGLVRQSSSSAEAVVSIPIRITALRQLAIVAQTSADLVTQAIPVFIQVLGDPNAEMRDYALVLLKYFNVDTQIISSECLETGHSDLGIEALKMLTEGGSLKQGQAILEQAMLTRTDDLALEAAKLLLDNLAMLKVARQALDAVNNLVRERAIDWLSEDYDNPKVKKLLYSVLTSRYAETRAHCISVLVVKKDSMVLPSLILSLQQARNNRQERRAIRQFQSLGDVESGYALLDYIENKAGQGINDDDVFEIIGDFRDVRFVPRLLTMLENKDWCDDAYSALVCISGFDQYIENSRDGDSDLVWMERQSPRHDSVLNAILVRCLELGQTDNIYSLLDDARWSQSQAVNDILNTLTKHCDDHNRRKAVYAVAWRARYRKGSIDAVLSALQHKDPETQFIAAEGLGLLGNAQGIGILLASVDTLSDINLRKRAVYALGELGDARALDCILHIVNDNEHALQAYAAEAIGHLGHTDKHDDIFTTFKILINSDTYGVKQSVIRGLRYFNSDAGWKLIHQQAEDVNNYYRAVALDTLGYDDDPATRDLLLRVLAEEDANEEDWGLSALTSARRLFGESDVSPDYALLRCGGQFEHITCAITIALKRVINDGSIDSILKVYPHCHAKVQHQLSAHLLKQTPLPIEPAITCLSSQHYAQVDIAATILGYSSEHPKPPPSLIENLIKALEAAFVYWREQWDKLVLIDTAARTLREEQSYKGITETLQRLLWCSGKLNCAFNSVATFTQINVNDSESRGIRMSAFTALSQIKHDSALGILTTALTDADQGIRAFVAKILEQQSHIIDIKSFAGQVIADRQVYQTLTRQVYMQDVNMTALNDAHLQSSVLSQVIDNQHVEALVTTAINNSLEEATQQVAIEGLSQIATIESEHALVEIANNDSLDEDLRKIAWRCLRRSKRNRTKQSKRQAG